MKGHTLDVKAVAFSPNGKVLASGSYEGTIRLWRIGEDEPVVISDKYPDLFTIKFSPDGKILASGSYSRTVRLWDVHKWGAIDA